MHPDYKLIRRTDTKDLEICGKTVEPEQHWRPLPWSVWWWSMKGVGGKDSGLNSLLLVEDVMQPPRSSDIKLSANTSRSHSHRDNRRDVSNQFVSRVEHSRNPETFTAHLTSLWCCKYPRCKSSRMSVSPSQIIKTDVTPCRQVLQLGVPTANYPIHETQRNGDVSQFYSSSLQQVRIATIITV